LPSEWAARSSPGATTSTARSVGGYADEFVTSPIQVAGLAGVVAATGGANHSLAVEGDGAAWAWGSDAAGQLGDGVANLEAQPPTRVLGKYNFLVAGEAHGLGL
jgi:alpha-tubulin suppressor-like RCC1 family protein